MIPVFSHSIRFQNVDRTATCIYTTKQVQPFNRCACASPLLFRSCGYCQRQFGNNNISIVFHPKNYFCHFIQIGAMSGRDRKRCAPAADHAPKRSRASDERVTLSFDDGPLRVQVLECLTIDSENISSNYI